MEKIYAVKDQLKTEAKELRDVKFDMKSAMRRGDHDWRTGGGALQSKLIKMKHEWRHKHVAYCLLKGRSLEQIERHCAEGNELDLSLVEKFKAEFIDAND